MNKNKDLEYTIQELEGQKWELERKIFQFQTLYEIGKEINPSLGSKIILSTVLSMIMGTFAISRGFIVLGEYDKEDCQIISSRGLSNFDLEREFTSVQHHFLLTSKPIQLFTSDLTPEHPLYPLFNKLGLELWLSINITKNISGGIALGSRISREKFNKNDLALLNTIINNSILNVRSAFLLEELKATSEQLAHKVEHLTLINEISNILTTIFDVSKLYYVLLEKIVNALKSTSGLFFIYTKENKLEIKAEIGLNNIDEKIKEKLKEQLYKNFTTQILKTHKPLLFNLSNLDEENLSESNISLLAIPLIRKETIIGLVVLLRDKEQPAFTTEALNFLNLLAKQIAISLENRQLFLDYLRQEQEKIRIKDIFEQYMAPEVVKNIIASDSKYPSLSGERKEITVLIADIRSFTSISEKLDAAKIVKILNRHFSLMTDIVIKYEGIVDKFMGDAIMVLFGAPISHQNTNMKDPERAVCAALEMQIAFNEIEEKLNSKFPSPLSTGLGIGISTGELIVGNIGSLRRKEYTVIGSPANLVSRIADVARGGEILINQNTFEKVKDKFLIKTLKPVQLKGFSELISVYKIIEKVIK